MTEILGVVLAGGLATRMGGQDKGLLSLHGRPILDHVVSRLTPQVDAIILNANGDPDRFSDYPYPVVGDTLPGFLGPLAGVLAAMEHAKDAGYTWVVSVAADTPFFPQDLVAQLRMVADPKQTPVVLAASLDENEQRYMRHPTFGMWHVSLAQPLAEALGDGVRKIVRWTDSVGGAEVRFDRPVGQVDPFFNVNTPDDLAFANAVRME